MRGLDQMIANALKGVMENFMSNNEIVGQIESVVGQVKARFDKIDSDNAAILKAQEAIAQRLDMMEANQDARGRTEAG